MTTKFHLQLQMTLMTLTELQMHTDNPDKYETYERNIKLVKEQIMNEEEKQKKLSDHKPSSATSINVALGYASGKPSRPFGPAGDWTLAAATAQ